MTRQIATLASTTLIRGGNITVNNQTWGQMWATWDWAGWIKFQVDAAVSLGANCIRLIGSVTQGVSDQATYLSQWKQFLDYTASIGVHAYPCGGDFHPDHWGTTTDQQAATLYAAWGGLCNSYPHVIALDVSNEGFGQGAAAGLTYAQVLARMTSLTSTLRGVAGKPISHSRAFSASSNWSGAAGNDLRAISDLHDIHVYYNGLLPADINGLTNLAGGDLPIMIGEFGALGTGQPTSNRTARYSAVRDLITTRTEVIGGLAWAIADTNTDPSFGTSGMIAANGTPRTDIATVFSSFPIARPLPRVARLTIGGQTKTFRLN